MASGTYGPPVESVHYLLLSGLPDGVTADGVEFYLSNSFDEVNDVVLLDSGTARAEVIGDNESIKEFLKRKHRIRKQQIEVKLTDPASVSTSTATPDVLGVDCYPDLIEVTFDNDIDTDTIQMYFESKRSGGKREKVVESIKKFEEGVIHVQFESPDDAAAVIAQQEHSIKVKKMPRKLEVCYVPLATLKKYDKNKLVLKDIPKGVEEEFLSLFIEKHLGLDEEDFTIVLRPNFAILVLKYSYTDEELNEMVENLRIKKLKKEQLTIERCEVNYSICVAGITNKGLASEDGLEFYFESSKSGGREGVVEKIEMLAKDKAKVTFKDHLVIQGVLKKKHTKLGPSVCITECSVLDSLDDGTIEDEEAEEKFLNISKQKKSKKKNIKTFSSSDDDETDASSPPPLVEVVTSPQVPLDLVHYPLDPLLAKYVRLKPGVTKGIEIEFQVKITADDAGIITISPSPSSPPDWPEKAIDMMQEFISSSLTKVDLSVPPEVSSSVYQMIMKECADEGLQFALGQGSNEVAIAGHIDAVTKLQHDVHELCGRMIQRVEEVKLSKEDFTYLRGWMLSRVQQQHKAVKLQCHDDRLSLSIDGSMKDVDEVKSKLSQYLVHSKVPVNLQPEALKFLHDDQPGRQKLSTMLKGHPEVIPYFSHSANNQLFFLFLCSSSHIDRAECVATTIQQEIVVQSIDLPQSFSRQVSDLKFASFQTNLAKKYSFSATVNQNKLTLVSTRSSIADISREFHTFVTEACSVTDVIHFKRGVWRLLHSTSMDKKWTDLLENMKKKGVEIVSSSKPTAQKPYIKIKGEVCILEFEREKIIEFQGAVKERQVPISHPGIGQYFLSNPQCQTMLNGIAYEANVCIEVEVSKENSEDDEPFMVLHIYGETESMVQRAQMKVQSTFHIEKITDPAIAAFTDETVHELKSFAKNRNVNIEIDLNPALHSVYFVGLFQDVMLVKDKVRDAMSSISQEESKKAAAASVSKTVCWIRFNPDDKQEEYDEILNYEIEQAYQKKKKVFYATDDCFVINFDRMEEEDTVIGTIAIVKRLDITKQEKPDNWDPMPLDSQGREKQFHLFTLQATSPEYKTVETAFNKTIAGRYTPILSIQRLQNPTLYRKYAVRKKEMEKHNPKGHQNERLLWHGTSPDTLDKINTRGFDRNFAGRNATLYGKGVYFARDASYSHGYTSPDANGVRHMYYTQVLTGEFTRGDGTMLAPPLKNPQVDPNVTFDATVNNVADPSIFVVYQDAHIYPAYLINYQ